MRLKLSLAVISCLVVSNLSADASENLKSAFTDGAVNGGLILHNQTQNNSGENKDSGFSMGSIELGYETGDFNGFKAVVGFRSSHRLSEKEDGDFNAGIDGVDDGYTQVSALMHTANISYVNEYFTATAGRQELELEWLTDYNEAYILGITAVPDTTIVIGHSDRKTVADLDAPLEDYEDTGKHGASVIDIKYEGVDGLVLNAYGYNAKDIADWYGAKVDYDNDMSGITAQYAVTSEDGNSADDGSIVNAEIRGKHSGISLNLGYITTDKDGGIGSMDTAGDSINPLEDGNQVYEKDADTVYTAIGYELDRLVLSGMYGQTKYGSNEEDELNILAEYGFNDEFTISALYVEVTAEDGDDDYNAIKFLANYTF
ncbi:MAG: Opr family porin [Sulfurospirillum sp.]|nr:Opr family porin [Sulfurospirillum sp.]MBL0702430.1 Opr family porin [Sulfurospirillum sp.]